MRKWCILLLSLLLFLVSCGRETVVSISYKAGIEQPTVVEDAALIDVETDAFSDTEAAVTEAIVSPGTVYYTEKGSVWHRDRSCSSLKNSKNVLSGTVEEAESVGKSGSCKRCGS